MYNPTQKGIEYLVSLDSYRTQNAKEVIRKFTKQKLLKPVKNDINNICVSQWDTTDKKRYWILREDLFFWS